VPAKDHHIALRSEILGKINTGGIEIVLAKLQWSKDDIAFTLHVTPNTFTSAGLQTTDWLRFLGFKENAQCQFSSLGRCYSEQVPEGYDLQRFAAAFTEGFGYLQKAEAGLQACGVWLPEIRQLSARGRAFRQELGGDGHTAMSTKPMKSSEDDKFRYQFTFIDTGREKGFVTHYRPRHPPLSSEVRSVFRYLGLKEFHQCPEFDFEACHYRTLQLLETENPFDGNVNFAHQSFDAHSARFSPAVEALLAANAAAERVGLTFLPIAKPADRLRDDIVQQIRLPTNTKKDPKSKPTMAFDAALPSSFDVAISFAGTERELAEKLAESLRAAGIAVFYDDFYPEHLWGKNLTAFLDEIYRKRAKFCVVFVSTEYKERKWTNHELRSAQARALEQKGDEYILPVKVDDTELDGLPPNVAYVGITLGIEKIAELLIKKLQG
jgi:hypothetical protein